MKLRRTNIFKNLFLAALFAATLAAGTGNAHASLGLDFNASTNPLINSNGGPAAFGASSGYPVVGWSFTATADLSLNRLGLYDADIDRMHTELHQVGIWSATDQSTPLAAVTVSEYNNTPEQSSGGSYFHWVGLSNVVLKAGQTYFVGATTYSGPPTNNSSNTTDYDTFAWIGGATKVPVTVNPYITYGSSAYAVNSAGNQLVFPGTTVTNDYLIGANIDVTPTPIPAAFWLLGSGLMGLAGIRRKKD